MKAEYPLEGINVVELGTHVAIPSAARVMADMGANVVKVEGLSGDGWRYVGTEFSTPVDKDENPFFAMQNCNKKLVSINIKSEDGIAFLKKLLDQADVFMTSVREGALKKQGLDYESLKKEYPKLIYCQNTGYGREGEESPKPGFDQATFWSRTGGTVDWGVDDVPPVRPSIGFGDTATGAQLLIGVLSALVGRETSGHGTYVTSSLLGSGVWYNGGGIVSAQKGYEHHYPEDRTNPTNPFTGFYKAKDGEWFTMVAFIDSSGWDGLKSKMYKVLGMEDWLEDTEEKPMPEIVARVNAEIAKKDRQEWFEIFKVNNVVFEKCAHLRELSEDPQVLANGYLMPVQFQNGNTALLPCAPVSFSEYQMKPPNAMGRVGTDTRDVMKELGYSDDEIDKMSEEKAIRMTK